MRLHYEDRAQYDSGALISVIAAPALAFSLNEMLGMLSGSEISQPTAGLLDSRLGTELKVTPQQAIGGTGALLGLATMLFS